MKPHQTISVIKTLVSVICLLLSSSTIADISFSQKPAHVNDAEAGSIIFKFADSPSIMQTALDTKVRMDITGVINRVTVEQIFTNPSNEWVEGVYVFPLPEDSAVDHLTMFVNERIIEGQIKEREEAKKTYEKAKSEGKSASLVEQQRPNIFTTSVANIAPGATIGIAIQYQQAVLIDNDKFSIRFPMVVGDRYIPGTMVATPNNALGVVPNTHQVNDASKITPPSDRRADLPITININLKAGFEVASLDSSYHKIVVIESDELTKQISLDQNYQADRDFELTWSADKSLSPELALFTQQKDDHYYLMLMATPPKDDVFKRTNTPREVIFIIDSSGSMAGGAMSQAKRALNRAIARLKPTDRFNIIDFDDGFRPLFKGAVPAIERNKQNGKYFVNGLKADGGTEALDAIEYGLGSRDSNSENYLRQVIFLTDGQVGDEDEIFRTVKWKIENDRFFSIGIGSAPNSFLLTKLAELGRGAFTYIGSTQEVGQKMHDLFEKLESPALTDIEVDFPPEVNAELALGTISDLYAGETITAVYKVNVLPDNLIISGNGINGVFSKNITINSSNNTKGLDVLWGRRKIDRLKDIYNNQFKKKSRDLVKQDIVTLALQHHLVSDFTSLVAVDVTPTRPESEQLNSQSIVKKRKAYLSSNYNPQDVALEAELALFEAELAQFMQSSTQLNSMASSSAFLAMNAVPNRQSSAYALPANNYAAAQVPAAAIVVPASRTATNSQLFMYVGALILLLSFILRRRKPV